MKNTLLLVAAFALCALGCRTQELAEDGIYVQEGISELYRIDAAITAIEDTFLDIRAFMERNAPAFDESAFAAIAKLENEKNTALLDYFDARVLYLQYKRPSDLETMDGALAAMRQILTALQASISIKDEV